MKQELEETYNADDLLEFFYAGIASRGWKWAFRGKLKLEDVEKFLGFMSELTGVYLGWELDQV